MKFWLLVSIALMVGLDTSTATRSDEPTTQPDQRAPAIAKTPDAIEKAIEPHKGFGPLQSAEFHIWRRKIFAIWNCPFSGIGNCLVDVYYYDYEKDHWTRFIDREVVSGGDLSVEMPVGAHEIVIRDNDGKVVIRQSVAGFPQKN